MSLHRFIHRAEKDKEVAEEIEAHLAHEQDANTARGLSPEEAQRQARLRLGNPQTLRERIWCEGSIPWMEDVWRDLQFALRSLRKAPGLLPSLSS
jgi:hypothetical protein